MAMDTAALNECMNRIARGWFSAMPEGQWTSAQLFWAEAGGIIYSSTVAADLDGQPRTVSQPKDVHDALREIREGMAEPGRGTWISVSMTLTPQGVLETNYNWDRRFYWGDQEGFPWAPDTRPGAVDSPSDDQFLAELERFPREPMLIPAWYPRRGLGEQSQGVAATADATQAVRADADERFASVLASNGALPGDIQPLMDAWGWPGVVESVRNTIAHALGQIPEELKAALAGERGDDARRAALVEFRDGVAQGAMASVFRSGAVVAIRLVEGYQAIHGGTLSGVESFRNAAPLEEYRNEQAMQPVIGLIFDRIVAIATTDLSARFGTEIPPRA